MPYLTFSYSPDNDDKETDVKMISPSLDYRLEIPASATLFVDDVHYHVNAWLRGLGYVISEE